ncbi:phosphoribosyltransferase [Chelatococcus reniformis]|uniref:Phosphoribosyltransferase n=1 Tax=Chelatococcus reniformis TaxID=1494448 RepID=A0A916X7N0_9HYPH|nr:phosphoribosyltransferase [Chelatococcus reniformis]
MLALPRGGVPVAFEAARALDAELDVLLVRKIGAPGQPELALGAIVGGAEPVLVLNDDLVRAIAPPPGYIAAAEARALAEIERRRTRYGGWPGTQVRGRTVIVIDDGIATGATVRAALQAICRGGPARLVLAVPVAPADALPDLAPLCDELVCLATLDPFRAVGLAYEDFSQTSDEEVVALLEQARGTGDRGDSLER